MPFINAKKQNKKPVAQKRVKNAYLDYKLLSKTVRVHECEQRADHLPANSTDSLSIVVFPSTAKYCSFSKVWMTPPSEQATIFPKCAGETPSF